MGLSALEKESERVKDAQNEYEEELKNEATNIELEENEYEIYQNVKNRIRQETASLNTKKSGLDNVYVRKQDEFDAVQNEYDILQKREEKLTTNTDEIKQNIQT